MADLRRSYPRMVRYRSFTHQPTARSHTSFDVYRYGNRITRGYPAMPIPAISASRGAAAIPIRSPKLAARQPVRYSNGLTCESEPNEGHDEQGQRHMLNHNLGADAIRPAVVERAAIGGLGL